jgi:hypothetical protein
VHDPEVERRHDALTAVPAARAENGAHLAVLEHRPQIREPSAVLAGEVRATRQDGGAEPRPHAPALEHPKPGSEPLLVDRSRGRHHADDVARPDPPRLSDRPTTGHAPIFRELRAPCKGRRASL